jgi:hypothetical protein
MYIIIQTSLQPAAAKDTPGGIKKKKKKKKKTDVIGPSPD